MIAVLCHLDVVPPGEGWETEPFSLIRRNGLLIGRGISDNKGPAVCALFALLQLRESGYRPACRIRLIFGLDEEHGSTCMEHYAGVEELPVTGFTPDASFPAIFAEKGLIQLSLNGSGSRTLEMTGGDAYNMVPSSCMIKENTTGRIFSANGVPAHASTPEKGVNAILEAVFAIPDDIANREPVIAFLRKYLKGEANIRTLISCAPGDISGELTVNVGITRINGEESMVGFDIRYPVESDGEAIQKEISIKAAEYGLSTRCVNHLPPLYTPPDSISMIALRDAYKRHVRQAYLADHPGVNEVPGKYLSSDPIAIGGATYARSIPNIVAFGPLFPWEAGCMHQKNEHFSEKGLWASVALYQDAIRSICETIEV